MIEFEDFRVLFTPRTGSRTMEKFLLAQGGRRVGIHHTQADQIPRDGKTHYTMTREPYTQLESWYHSVYTHTRCTFIEFIHLYSKKKKFKPMNIYMDIIRRDFDEVFVYETGLEFALTEMGFTIDSPLPIIGASGRKPYPWTEEERALVESYFPEDCEFYTLYAATDYLMRKLQEQ